MHVSVEDGLPRGFPRVDTHIEPIGVERVFQTVEISDLHNGMMVMQDIRSRNGLLIVTKGQVVTDTFRRCLRNHYTQKNIPSKVRVSSTLPPRK